MFRAFQLQVVCVSQYSKVKVVSQVFFAPKIELEPMSNIRLECHKMGKSHPTLWAATSLFHYFNIFGEWLWCLMIWLWEQHGNIMWTSLEHMNITACVFRLGDTTYCCGAFTRSATTSCFLGLGHGGGSSHYRERPPVSGVLDTIWAHSHGRRQPLVSWELDTCCGTFIQSEMIACMSWDLDTVLWCVRTVRDYNLHVLGLRHCCGTFTPSQTTAYVS